MKPMDFAEKYASDQTENVNKETLREQLQRDVDAFLESGGVIERIPSGVGGEYVSKVRRDYAISRERHQSKKTKGRKFTAKEIRNEL